jgi:hypothetical protein
MRMLLRVLSDPETMRFYPAPYDRAGVEDWIARGIRRYAEHGHGLWAMVLKASGEMIGDCGLTVQNVDGADEIEIGYHVRRDLWGQGLATEAAPRLPRLRIRAPARREAHFVDLPRKSTITTGRGEERNDRLERGDVAQRIASCLHDSPRAGAWKIGRLSGQ